MPTLKSGRRRRPCQVWWTTSLPAAAANPVTPPRVLVARPRGPARPLPRITSCHTVLPTGGNQGHGAPTGGAKTPVLIVRGRGQPRWPLPTIRRPQLASIPNLPPPSSQRVRPRPLVAPDPRIQGRYRPIVRASLPSQRPNLPGQTVHVVRFQPPRRGPSPPIIRPLLGVHSLQFPRSPVTVRVPRPPARPVVVVHASSGAGIRPILPGRSIRPPGTVRPLPPPVRRISVWSGQAWPRLRPARSLALVVPRPRPPVRPSIVVHASSGTGYQTSQRRPIVVPRPAALKLPPRLITPAPRYPLQSPAQHGPMPSALVFWRRYGAASIEGRSPAQSYRRITVNPPQPIPAVNPPTAGGSTLPDDLVAAAIAWLRLNPTIVAALGDAVTPKFASDAEPRNQSPPYLVFYEPDEDEGYESIDSVRNQASSVCEGRLGMELVCPAATGKLGTRQLAETITAALNDAPLTFADGVLIYLRRTQRHFPTIRETGPGANTVVWKRVIEFKYFIERWAPQF